LIIAPLFIIAGGIMILTAGIKPDQLQKGKSIITGTIIGLVIALLSWTILNMIFNALADQGGAGFPWPWNQIQCTGGGVAEGKPCTSDAECGNSMYCDFLSTNRCVTAENLTCRIWEDCPAPYDCGSNGKCTRTPGGGGQVTQGTCSGVSCSDTNLDICNTSVVYNCSISQVNIWDTQIRAAALGKSICSGIDTVTMVKAIMARESGGIIDTIGYDGLSAGLMHLIPSTAENFKSACNITDTITLDWLRDSANAQAQICIVIEYLRSLVSACGCTNWDLAAGYNGGAGACAQSVDCGSCVICSGYTRAYQCFWDDNAHTICNVDRSQSFSPTRAYVPQVVSCYDQF